ncbi:leucine-rich repeat domain-containing protein [Akkermansiaceae bacterium]|nr:leucine-rich repeat domain-containing protein [Akkermansiaceae bacterium]MDB4327992.1 leucine-rich repeat domain-containing protein [Akkermansiaceae bacterium]
MKPLQVLLALFACAFLPLHAASLDDLTYTTTDGKVTITDCNGSARGVLVIPATIEGNPVTSIGGSAFNRCAILTSITIPDSVNSIGDLAFANCTRLTSITIGNGVTSIGGSAFANCTSLASITIPDSVTSISRAAFCSCTSLTSITIPNSVTSIGYEAFYGCSSLTSISIPDSVTSIGYAAFGFCTSLMSITIPDKFVLSLDIIGLGNSFDDQGSGKPDTLYPVFNKAVAANDTVSSNTTRIEAIEGQLALLADALAAKDAEIANKNERIAQLEDLSAVPRFNLLLEEKEEQIAALELRPTQAAYDAVVTEKDARPTLEEIQDARTGSVILTPSEDGTVQLKIEIEESSDLEVWENQGKSVEAGFPLAEGKKFLRFALK